MAGVKSPYKNGVGVGRLRSVPEKIKEMRRQGISNHNISARTGISYDRVQKICKGIRPVEHMTHYA